MLYFKVVILELQPPLVQQGRFPFNLVGDDLEVYAN